MTSQLPQSHGIISASGGGKNEDVYTRILPGQGLCLYSLRAVKKGDIVLEERPILLTSGDSLPPMSIFAPIGRDSTAVKLLRTPRKTAQNHGQHHNKLSDVIGGPNAWPQDTCFEGRHIVPLALEFVEASSEVQDFVLSAAYQTEIETVEVRRKVEQGEQEEEDMNPVSRNCALAGNELRLRGAPWLQELPFTLDKFLRVCTINAHSFNKTQSALFNLGTKITHSCHNPNVHYSSDPNKVTGSWTALRDIPANSLLKSCYLPAHLTHVSRALRRRILYAQKGFICQCESCCGAVELEGEEDEEEVDERGAPPEKHSRNKAGDRARGDQVDERYQHDDLLPDVDLDVRQDLLNSDSWSTRPSKKSRRLHTEMGERPDKFRRVFGSSIHAQQHPIDSTTEDEEDFAPCCTTSSGNSCSTRTRTSSSSTTAAAAFLKEEEVLTNAAMALYTVYPSDPDACPLTMAPEILTELSTLKERCEQILSDTHFVTQALRRLELTQQYTALQYVNHFDCDEKNTWTMKWTACEQYLAECECCDSTTSSEEDSRCSGAEVC
eukprot:TRINITY_DN18012_c0_g1_i1.p1 TRINITY_DN18012_c0_g1~~TRINITY_DN18012_c0_g1_i1.p1  ORF type:complete len:551 (-),score=33.72 TRINITY_DN18012_c0_g1_i1:15-1667(-)